MDVSTPEEEDFLGRLLHQAALWDNAELLEDLLRGDQLAHINSQDSWGRTPLHAAATTENSRCLRVLLQAGADPNIPCGPRGENKTPLHVCSEHGFVGNVMLLVAHKGDLMARDNAGMTPLDIAEKGEHAECMQVLKQAADSRELARHSAHAALRDACTSGDVTVVKCLIAQVGPEAELVVNMAPNGSNTLLYTACEIGRKDVVKVLLDTEADGRIHPVTRYSPLYIACFKGHKDVVELLLKKFPELVQQYTVEKWLPIHAACINNHVHIMDLLLKFPYPQHLLSTYRVKAYLPRLECTWLSIWAAIQADFELTRDGEWEYPLAFDVNMKDVTGQNVLYLACLLGNYKMVDVLLKFKVKATRVKIAAEDKSETDNEGEIPSPTRRRISDGILGIMSRLNLGNRGVNSDATERTMCPWELDSYCNNNTETALHAAVRGRHGDIVSALLSAGANPNILTQRGSSSEHGSHSEQEAMPNMSPLVEACRNRDIAIVDLLLKHGARDDDCRALAVVVKNRDDILTAKLLSIKAHPDPEHRINKKAMSENIPAASAQFGGLQSLTYSNMFANTAVMINWHCQRCQLSQIRPQWLVDAALHVNPKLRLNPRSQDVVLYAITRLDVSNNALTWLPPIVFQLQSLRYLNVAHNKIEKLPTDRDCRWEAETNNGAKGRKFLRHKQVLQGYSAPLLEELYLQYNRLEYLPDELFMLPGLVTLDVSNNKLSALPFKLWRAPKLKELNASFNLLKDLPTLQPEDVSDTLSVCSLESSRSVDSQLSSVADSILTPHSPSVQLNIKDKNVQTLDLSQHNVWSRSVQVMEQISSSDDDSSADCSHLSALNLAHNQFTAIPTVLSCLAVNLTRLNMAYNSLRSMSHITSYPSSLKQLDLSHNQVCCWPSLPQVEAADPMEQAAIACYATDSCNKLVKSITGRRQAGRSLRTAILNSLCTHRRHLRLDNLRTLILADNKISRIQLTTDDDGLSIQENEEQDNDWDVLGTPTGANTTKCRLMFPNLSMLDLSNNQLREIPPGVHELNNLSVLNVSGNPDIYELPPQMGLLSRLWNLSTRGCSLQEPLKSMIDSKKYKTMDVIGYLKSVLEDAKPYARMKLMIVGVQGIGKTSLLEQLRQEGSGTFKKKPVEHWAKRMGNKNINVKTARGTNMSTVGVDIGDWVYEKKVRGHSSHGPVVFRTWDFGGQREYYATHQYFLSKRSLYLVVWRIPDGQHGIAEILQWLVNIQARAPNSPVLIVGTHYDMMREQYPLSRSEDLQQYIREKFINIVDAEKCGLPRVLDTIEVSCKTRHNIKLLCNLIYDTVFSLRPPGSKELLLEQRVPASYLALEDVVGHIVAERKQNGVDPVLNAEEYKSVVWSEMQYRYQKTFRDAAELHQATLFLHDNGVLLHYDDATLKDLYFLDPQWLCDMLAHVVTIREINPFARSGIMKLDDLKHVFKSSNIGPVDTRGYIVNLLNKFEVALTWDNRTLLIPSLLPAEDDIHAAAVKVKIPVRSRGWAVRNKKISSASATTLVGNSSFYSGCSSTESVSELELSPRSDPEVCVRRLLLMSYFPSGFWSRLITRILADDSIVDIVRSFFIMPKEVTQDARLAKLLDVRAEWVLWQTGMELRYSDSVLFRMKEVIPSVKNSIDYRKLRLQLKQEGIWIDVDLNNSSILEILLPLDTLVIKRPITDEDEPIGYQAIVLDPSPECSAQLLALAVDHVDILLEDWYPTLGTRFVHTSEGRFLVTRLVPCPRCLASTQEAEIDNACAGGRHHLTPPHLAEVLNAAEIEHPGGKRVRKSQESYTSDGDSGVGPDSAGSSRKTSVEGHPLLAGVDAEIIEGPPQYSWMVEECILAAYDKSSVRCPVHGDISLAHIAPDTMFLDLGERHLIRPNSMTRGRLLGRGAFGFVFKGTCRVRGSNDTIDVAMKMLQPVPPGPNASHSAIIAYKGAQGKWDRDPLQYASKAYCTARQELNILLTLRHPNIVPLVGVCTRPLALVLDLAPMGALDITLRHYRRSGAKLGPYTLQAIILQVAKAIEYLHQQHIIYRDLKSENVLVWSLPQPFEDQFAVPVHIKLADYGISRLTLPSGTKGFGGTEGFMAPEIMRYNGEEEYTEKVDCFSFGMFVYELLTLHQPFESHESVKECILEGGRPPLTHRETAYPTYILDLMVLCWCQQPRDRPSASQIVSIASAPEFTHLYDIVSLNHSAPVVATVTAPLQIADENSSRDDSEVGGEVWLACGNSRADQLVVSGRACVQYSTLIMSECPTAACLVDNCVWLGDTLGQIHAYSIGNCCHIFSYMLDNADTTSVCSLLYLSQQNRVAVGLSNGRIFLVRSDASPSAPTMGEGSFVMSELGSSTVLHTISAVFRDEGRECELWCGESHGALSIYSMKDNIVTGHEILNHYEPVICNVDVLQVVSSHSPIMYPGGQVSVWTYVYPGCVVYQWDPDTRTIVNKLDCSKLVPCSESLKSISIEEHLSPGRCQVTSLCILDNELYIGTTWGCIVVAERSTMRPITVFRPFQEEVASILALKPANEGEAFLMTIGRGYRSLIKRYKDVVGTPTLLNPSTQTQNNTYALLWAAQNWAAS